MTALRLPNAFPPHFVSFVWRYHRPHHLFVTPGRPREVGSVQARMFTIHSLATHTPSLFPMEQSGSPRFLGSPTVPLPCSRDPGRATLPLPSQQDGIVPALGTTKTATTGYFGADSQGFSTRCLRFQLRLSLHWQDSLSAGGSPYRVGVEPTGLLQRISSAALSPPIPTLQT
jgi:hypothetical protein